MDSSVFFVVSCRTATRAERVLKLEAKNIGQSWLELSHFSTNMTKSSASSPNVGPGQIWLDFGQHSATLVNAGSN